MATVLCGDNFKLSRARVNPLALFTPDGSTITAPLLKMTCNSRFRS